MLRFNNFPSCCGLSIASEFGDNFTEPPLTPTIINNRCPHSLALVAVTAPYQTKAEMALAAAGFKIISTFRGNAGQLKLWLRDREIKAAKPVKPSPAKKLAKPPAPRKKASK